MDLYRLADLRRVWIDAEVFEKDIISDLLGMGMQKIHGLVHVPQLQPLAGGQVDFREPTIPDAELGLGIAESVGHHGKQGTIVGDLNASSLFDILKGFSQPQPFP